MDKGWIYKDKNGEFQYSGFAETYTITTSPELADIPESDNMQLAVVLAGESGYELYTRLPGGMWIPDTAEA